MLRGHLDRRVLSAGLDREGFLVSPDHRVLRDNPACRGHLVHPDRLELQGHLAFRAHQAHLVRFHHFMAYCASLNMKGSITLCEQLNTN